MAKLNDMCKGLVLALDLCAHSHTQWAVSTVVIATDSKRVLPSAQQANKVRFRLLGQGWQLCEPEDREDYRLKSQRIIFSGLEFRLFSKGEKLKSDTSWFPSASGGDVLISSSLQSSRSWPDQDVSCEQNKDILANYLGGRVLRDEPLCTV